MATLKQQISDPEKHSRIRAVIEQHLHNKSFGNYKELSDALDVSSNTLYQVMKGSRTPPDILIYKFCDFFNYDPDYFFGRSEKLTAHEAIDREITRADILNLQKIGSQLNDKIIELLIK